MFTRIHRKFENQVLVSTHSGDILRDEGIGLDEVLLLFPGKEGTKVRSAGSIEEVKALLEQGESLADNVIPQTRPQKAYQLTLFGDREEMGKTQSRGRSRKSTDGAHGVGRASK